MSRPDETRLRRSGTRRTRPERPGSRARRCRSVSRHGNHVHLLVHGRGRARPHPCARALYPQGMSTMWGIHNNRTEIDPVADSAVRIGWDEMGDLSTLAPSRDAFKEAVGARMPDVEPGQVPSTAGTLYR